MRKKLRKIALDLNQKGFAAAEISEKLSIPQSTAYRWIAPPPPHEKSDLFSRSLSALESALESPDPDLSLIDRALKLRPDPPADHELDAIKIALLRCIALGGIPDHIPLSLPLSRLEANRDFEISILPAKKTRPLDPDQLARIERLAITRLQDHPLDRSRSIALAIKFSDIAARSPPMTISDFLDQVNSTSLEL